MIILFARSVFISVCMSLLPINVVFALEPGESIVLDPVTCNYTLTYSDQLDDGSKILSQATFVPATKIVPTLDSKFYLNQAGTVTYSYSVSSGAQSRQILTTVRFDLAGKVVGSQDLPTDMKTSTVEQAFAVLAANEQALSTPTGWRGAISTNKSGESRISWHPDRSAAGIPPKGHLKGFGFRSQSLPGLDVAQFEGNSGILGYGGEGPDPDSDIAKQIQVLEQNDFVPRKAAVPVIAVPIPFDAAALLGSIQAQTHKWIAMNLLDATFSTQLDRYFQSAISAYRLNQPRVGMQQIEALRALIRKEQPDMGRDEEHESDRSHEKNDDGQTPLIDKLAARVLDFDLSYVTKRMDEGAHEREDGEHKPASQIER